ncbi:MAG: alginate lyase family protein [Dysgonamonadaceae bacterium]|jgi:hypothetical protein|nr:alginate lyase family protein [Dysgonamonadaceae bacterium]
MRKQQLVLLALFWLPVAANAQWMWNINKLNEIKKDINLPEYNGAYRQLIDEADNNLNKKPYSVTFKTGKAPSGDKHDYVSLSRYYWADPSKKDGLPYINRDGESNPELDNYDRNPLGNMASDVTTLSLAYFYSGDKHYAKKAVKLLRVWFLDKKTKMNPNLNYAQFIPGTNDNKGRASGLIDSYSFVEMLNAVKLLESSKDYTEKDRIGLQKWFEELINWWKTDKNAIAEKNSTNNHGLAYDVQLATFSLFVGDKKTAMEIIKKTPENRLFKQIEPDGKMPRELTRTLAFHYSVYNLYFMVDMAATARNLEINLCDSISTDGRSLYKAVDFLTHYIGKDLSAWQYKQISGWDKAQQNLCEELFRLSAINPARKDYFELYKKYSKIVDTDRNILLY